MKELLVRHELAYRFLARVFHEQPSAAFINRLVADDLFAQWPLDDDTEDTRSGVCMMRAFCAVWDAQMLPDLESDFNRLFVGPRHPLAPPWESYYLSRDHLLFQEQTLAVRQIYRRFGLETSSPGSVPDDSLGLELAFMAELCARRCAAPGQDEIREAQQGFLDSHLLLWAPQCLRLVIEHSRLDYYRGAAYLALGILHKGPLERG